jgi:predicted O-methyltransferase YrrM
MTLELLAPEVAAYLEGLVPPRPPRLTAMEAEAERTDFPIIGPAVGHLCYLLARLSRARTVFELGSGFGYSTAWFARAVEENGGGTVHHVVWDAKFSARAREHLDQLGYGHLVQYHVGEAVETLRGTAGPFDLIFNDIDKAGYPAALGPIAEKLRPGGLLIVDNLLWHGRIFDPADQSADTAGVRAFTRMISSDPRWAASIVPLRDGVLVACRQER